MARADSPQHDPSVERLINSLLQETFNEEYTELLELGRVSLSDQYQHTLREIILSEMRTMLAMAPAEAQEGTGIRRSRETLPQRIHREMEILLRRKIKVLRPTDL